MTGARVIRVPKEYYDQALMVKRRYFEQQQLHVPLWRCMIALEKGNDRDDLFRRRP